MRTGLALSLAMAIAACDGAGDGGGAQPPPGAPRTPSEPAGSLTLRDTGLTITGPMGIALDFSSNRAVVESEIEAVLGAPEESGSCAAVLDFVRYDEGLTLTFDNVGFAGWTTAEPRAPVVPASASGAGEQCPGEGQ